MEQSFSTRASMEGEGVPPVEEFEDEYVGYEALPPIARGLKQQHDKIIQEELVTLQKVEQCNNLYDVVKTETADQRKRLGKHLGLAIQKIQKLEEDLDSKEELLQRATKDSEEKRERVIQLEEKANIMDNQLHTATQKHKNAQKRVQRAEVKELELKATLERERTEAIQRQQDMINQFALKEQELQLLVRESQNQVALIQREKASLQRKSEEMTNQNTFLQKMVKQLTMKLQAQEEFSKCALKAADDRARQRLSQLEQQLEAEQESIRRKKDRLLGAARRQSVIMKSRTKERFESSESRGRESDRYKRQVTSEFIVEDS